MTSTSALTMLVALSVSALFLLPPAALQAEESAGSIPMRSAFGDAADAGGFSESTGEQAAAWALLVATVEDPAGAPHGGFDGPRHVMLLTTVSGRTVIRFLGSAGGAETMSLAGQ